MSSKVGTPGGMSAALSVTLASFRSTQRFDDDSMATTFGTTELQPFGMSTAPTEAPSTDFDLSMGGPRQTSPRRIIDRTYWEQMEYDIMQAAKKLENLGETTATPGIDGKARLRILTQRLDYALKARKGKTAVVSSASKNIAIFRQHRQVSQISTAMKAKDDGDVATLISCVKCGLSPDYRFNDGFLLAEIFTYLGESDHLQDLLDLGANPTVPTKFTIPLVAVAVMMGRRHVVAALLMDPRTDPSVIFALPEPYAKYGPLSPIAVSILQRDAMSLKMLCAHPLYRRHNRLARGRTSLMLACRANAQACVYNLLEGGMSAGAVDEDGYNALDWFKAAIKDKYFAAEAVCPDPSEWPPECQALYAKLLKSFEEELRITEPRTELPKLSTWEIDFFAAWSREIRQKAYGVSSKHKVETPAEDVDPPPKTPKQVAVAPTQLQPKLHTPEEKFECKVCLEPAVFRCRECALYYCINCAIKEHARDNPERITHAMAIVHPKVHPPIEKNVVAHITRRLLRELREIKPLLSKTDKTGTSEGDTLPDGSPLPYFAFQDVLSAAQTALLNPETATREMGIVRQYAAGLTPNGLIVVKEAPPVVVVKKVTHNVQSNLQMQVDEGIRARAKAYYGPKASVYEEAAAIAAAEGTIRELARLRREKPLLLGGKQAGRKLSPTRRQADNGKLGTLTAMMHLDGELTRVRAATIIQRVYRGWKIRRLFTDTAKQEWTYCWDSTNEVYYYVNLVTGESRWSLPACLKPHEIHPKVLCHNCYAAGSMKYAASHCSDCCLSYCFECTLEMECAATHTLRPLSWMDASCRQCLCDFGEVYCADDMTAYCAACWSEAYPEHTAHTIYATPTCAESMRAAEGTAAPPGHHSPDGE